MSTLTRASYQWATRPDDERYTSLHDMADHFARLRANSRALTVSTRALKVVPNADNAGLMLAGDKGVGYAPTHWSFGQLAGLAEAPAGYLRTLDKAAPIVADCLNYGLQFKRNIEDVGLLLYKNGDEPIVRAATGPKYGRIWNEDVVNALINFVGDGVSGDWRVPGEFGRPVDVTKANTTLYASDRDMFVFLADEKNRIEVPNRRDGKPGLLARGVFMWNSEVGSATFGIATFLFDYVCMNRTVWGATQYGEIKIRHSAGAPDRWIEEARPALASYAQGSTRSIVDGIKAAQAARIAPDKVDDFLKDRFGARMVGPLKMTAVSEEGRPIESVWDVVTAATAYARGIPHQDARVAWERQAGALLEKAAA